MAPRAFEGEVMATGTPSTSSYRWPSGGSQAWKSVSGIVCFASAPLAVSGTSRDELRGEYGARAPTALSRGAGRASEASWRRER
jgi:hypothetical protein